MMALSLTQCISKVKEAYPDMYPSHWVMYKGNYIFNLLPRGVDRRLANADFHAVSTSDGEVSGSIPLNILTKDKSLVALLKNRIIEMGDVPFYGTAAANIRSQNIALRCGFRPAWVETEAVKV